MTVLPAEFEMQFEENSLRLDASVFRVEDESGTEVVPSGSLWLCPQMHLSGTSLRVEIIVESKWKGHGLAH